MTYEALMQYALRIIAKKRYTRAEMTGKLEKFLKKAMAVDVAGGGEEAGVPENGVAAPENGAMVADVTGDAATTAAHDEDQNLSTPSSGLNTGLVDKVLARLEELKYLDDEQYAADYITTRIKLRPRGQFLLARELKIKGISSEIIKKKLTEQNISESEIAKNALEKRIRQWEKLPDQKRREKAFRFLSARGFAQDAIYKAINSCYSTGIEQNLY